MKKDLFISALMIFVVAFSGYFFMKYFGNEYIFQWMYEKFPDKEISMSRLENINYISIFLVYPLISFFSKLSRSSISLPPGVFILKITNFIFSKKVQDRVFTQLWEDMLEEYFQALDEGLIWKSRWIRVKTMINLIIAVLSQVSVSVIKLFIEFWKVI